MWTWLRRFLCDDVPKAPSFDESNPWHWWPLVAPGALDMHKRGKPVDEIVVMIDQATDGRVGLDKWKAFVTNQRTFTQ